VAIQTLTPAFRESSCRELAIVSAHGGRRRTDRVDNEQRSLGSLRSHVIAQPFFVSVLSRELRRAERSNLPTAIVLVSCGSNRTSAASEWRSVIAAVNAAKRETDIIGWFASGETLGIVLPEVLDTVDDALREFEYRIRRDLARRSEPLLAERVSIRFHVSPFITGATNGLPRKEELPREIRPRPEHSSGYAKTKRLLDILGSATLLLLLAPVLLAIAALVKLTSRGPVFFRQLRLGQMAKPFTMMKFRTMRVDADHALHQKFVTEFIKAGASAGQGGSAPFKIARDPRVTPIGRFLRKTSLDELPQLWNVLIGEMSLVGPRPPIPYEVEQYKLWHNRRLFEAKPGVTGLWQVVGRSRTTFDEMVRLDLRYVKSRSLWTDLKILLATPRAVISGKGAC
jgi:lipopolysaccharide/colanic/teichoic acid biosynthesis glycosyltransferase